jgi:predicted nucleotidyltransferase
MDFIDSNALKLKELCQRHHVEHMYLFGSALKGNLSLANDIDLLVRFKAIDLRKYFDNYLQFKEQLELLLGKPVDLVEEQTVKNPVLKDSINKEKKLIYG